MAAGRSRARRRRRRRAAVALAVVLGVGAGALALGLRPSAAADTFVASSSSGTYRATQRYYRDFGEEPVEVVVSGDLAAAACSARTSSRLVGLEGCLAGQRPAAGAAPRGRARTAPAAQLARLGARSRSCSAPARSSTRPPRRSTNSSAAQGNRAEAQARAGRSGRSARAALARGRTAAEARRLGERGEPVHARTVRSRRSSRWRSRTACTAQPALNDANFVSALVFDSAASPPGTPKQRFAYLFPAREAALISVRLRAGPRRSAARPDDHADPPRGGDAPVAAAARRRYLRHAASP